MSAHLCIRCGQRPATVATACAPCFDRWLFGKMFGAVPTEEEVVAREDAADLKWEREMMGEYPRAKPDATTRDREAA